MSLLLAVALLAAPEAEITALDPATTLVFVPDHRAPLVEVRLEVPVGRWSPWFRAQGGEAAWEALLLDPERALLRRADALAVDLSLHADSRSCTLRASFLREDLEPATALLRAILAEHALDRKELKRRARARTLGWRLSMKDPSFVLQRASAFLLFPEGDPRRLGYLPPPRHVPADAALRAAQARMLAMPGRALGVAGDLDRDAAISLARALLPPADAARPQGADPSLPAAVPLAQRQDVTETLPGLTQVYLADVRTSLPLQEADAPAWAIADHVLGGHFYARLSTALRHEGGETYGAWTRGTRETVETVYAASTFTRTDNAATAERKLSQVLRTFHEGGITEEEREAALGYLRGRLPFSRQEPAQILERALFERRIGLAPGTLDALVDRAEALSLEEVNAFIRRFYDPALFRRVRVGTGTKKNGEPGARQQR
ncbi:MAG TPA: insulinase family protein [Candidatus Polarisedimenticolaceae bacterium]|nr:insulinase family protein [Candidatus Polarisedimenticolaceae bacterium]